MTRAWKLWLAAASLLVASSCAAQGIEELGRHAIREQAEDGMDWFNQFTAAVDTSDRDLVRSRLLGSGVPYSFGWEANGIFYADRYYREHLTTSGGWWAEQRTVSACVRYTAQPAGPGMASTVCPEEPPYTDKVDERVTVP